MRKTSAIIASISASKSGAFTTAEAVAHGASRDALARLERTGLIRRVHRGTYVCGPIVTVEARRHCALMAAGPDALLSGLAALDEYGLLPRSSDAVEVVVSRRQRSLEGVLIKQSRTIVHEDRNTWNGKAMTTVERAIYEAAPRMSTHELCRVLREAAFRGLLRLPRLRRIIDKHESRPGVGRLRAALDQHLHGHGGVDSRGEARLARMLEREGVPDVACNVTLEVHGEKMRVDMLVEHLGLVIEFDPPNHDLLPVAREDALRTALCRAANLDHMRVRSNRMREAVISIRDRQQAWIDAGRPAPEQLTDGARIVREPRSHVGRPMVDKRAIGGEGGRN